jgi:putative membrane protein
LACAAIVGVIATVGIVLSLRNNPRVTAGPKSMVSLSFVILLGAIVIFAVPVRSLSSESFALRTSTNGVNTTQEERDKVRLKLKGDVDSTSFKFFDWISAKNLGENGVFKNKKFKGSGFITASSEPGSFNLSRFIVSCCIVDATPVSLLVQYDYQTQFKANDWVEVEGSFAIKTVEGKSQPVMIPTIVTKIPEPDNTYLDRT